MHYSVQPRNSMFVKGYRFSSFAKNRSKNLSGKYIQNLLTMIKNLQQMHLKPQKRVKKSNSKYSRSKWGFDW